MNTGDMLTKIEELLKSEKFVAKMAACESCEALAELFTAEGIPMSADDAEQLVAEVHRQGSGELDENDLESVAGGSLVGIVKTGILVGRLILSRGFPIVLPVLPRITPKLHKK